MLQLIADVMNLGKLIITLMEKIIKNIFIKYYKGY